MSGIGAVFHKGQWDDLQSEIASLAQGLRRYGRQQPAFSCFGKCGLVCVPAAHTPEPLLYKPTTSRAGEVFHLVFDGRLDNRDDLASALGLSANELARWPDPVLALKSWEKWEHEAPKHWVGEFAVIVWNSSKHTLVAARDQLGRRALSYYETPERLVIASAPRALFALDFVPKQIDEQKIADALVQMFHDGARSFYKNIWRLKPAHRLIATPSQTRIQRYWSLDDAPSIRLSSDLEYVESAGELLDRAIIACLRRNGPVGTYLTGGLDSSTVAVTALSHLHDQPSLPSFTWVPSRGWDGRCSPGVYGDETPFVEAIARMHPRLQPTFVRSEGHGLFHQLDEFLDVAGVAPRNAINLCWIHDINREAQNRGLSVLLDGGMGNMSFSWDGHGVLLEHLRNKAYGKLFNELFAGRFSPKQYAWRLLKMLLLPLAPDAVNAAYLLARGHLNSDPVWYKASAINPDFAREMKVDERMKTFGWDFFAKPSAKSRQFRGDLITDQSSNESADIKQAFRALYGVETRDPLGDRRLVEFCVGLPEAQFWRNGESRWLVKRLMHNRLPNEVLYNRRHGEQVIDWHLRMTSDLPQIREELDAIADDPDTSRYIDVKRIRRFLDNWPSETPLKPLPGHTYSFIPVSIGAALAAGRFVRRTKGSNR